MISDFSSKQKKIAKLSISCFEFKVDQNFIYKLLKDSIAEINLGLDEKITYSFSHIINLKIFKCQVHELKNEFLLALSECTALKKMDIYTQVLGKISPSESASLRNSNNLECFKICSMSRGSNQNKNSYVLRN